MGNCFCCETEKKELGGGVKAGCVKLCCGGERQKEVEVIYQEVTRGGYDMEI